MANHRSEETLSREMQQRYRNVFGTAEGQIVLGDLLRVAGFGDSIDPMNPAAVAYHNAAVEIARMAGALDGIFNDLSMTIKE